jgi:hypothetical protein
VGLFLLLAVLSPGFYGPLLDGRATVLGVRPIVPFLAALIGLFAIDVVAARWLRNGCLLTFIVSLTTVAGMFLVILAPALLLIVASFREILP